MGLFIADDGVEEVYTSKPSKNSPKTIQDINSYEEALMVTGDRIRSNPSIADVLLAKIKACNHIDNEGKEWIADFSDSNYKYIPYFQKNGSAWLLGYVDHCTSGTYCPVGFYFKTRSTAEYFVKRWLNEYSEWLG